MPDLSYENLMKHGLTHEHLMKELNAYRDQAQGANGKSVEKELAQETTIQQKRESPLEPDAKYDSNLRSDNSSLSIPEPAAQTPLVQAPPAWYLDLKPQGFQMNMLGKTKKATERQALIALDSMKDCIARCEKEESPNQLDKFIEELRDHVHKAEFLEVNKYIVRKKNMLDNTGLPRIFDTRFPVDLRADALQLYNRWYMQIFSVDPLRGIIKDKNRVDKRNADRIDPSWPGRLSAKYYGQGNLVIGQWWPTQLCTVRDGAHGAPQAGIYGEKDKGAYSIVLSGNANYKDEDKGDEIYYSGTDSKDSTPTENTTRMIESCDTVKQAVRVIRSWNLNKSNPYRPVRGFRYDGLYTVVGYSLVNADKAIYRFHLVRLSGQDPIRYEDNAARRPTRFEVAKYDDLGLDERGF
ncbi:uncharacterized protein BDR25DRAFT_28376 [Lindgomyces ingoldianus]|uniref:Uncharacterized protein n=1 Tax=Lindgomyces ingoldianus TaxID=673940 RepID=A0ACB6QVH7_9PLEO|nr:uncharacterized protein BDR25DRAFT_28376 [Lindgomyces ingoldianus]KAF2470941.1 hypothetical protein BDR25DRAFT_28376 [Lindgomyces ingoldianus]